MLQGFKVAEKRYSGAPNTPLWFRSSACKNEAFRSSASREFSSSFRRNWPRSDKNLYSAVPHLSSAHNTLIPQFRKICHSAVPHLSSALRKLIPQFRKRCWGAPECSVCFVWKEIPSFQILVFYRKISNSEAQITWRGLIILDRFHSTKFQWIGCTKTA